MGDFDATGPKSRENLERIYREVSGVNPGANFAIKDEEQQRIVIAKVLQSCMQRFDPLVLMSMLVIALGFMSDEHSVDREHLCKLLREAKQRHTLEMVGSLTNPLGE